jgi:hypothetical protein
MIGDDMIQDIQGAEMLGGSWYRRASIDPATDKLDTYHHEPPF